MPKKKRPKPTPIERIRFFYGIETLEIEVWDCFPDVRGSGSWKKEAAWVSLDLLISYYSDKLLNPLHPPNVCDLALKRLLGHRQTSKLVEELKPILRRNKLLFKKTALWLLARELQKTFATLRDTVISNEANLIHLPVNSPEAKIRQKMLKGAF